jgi:hypothetical protein
MVSQTEDSEIMAVQFSVKFLSLYGQADENNILNRALELVWKEKPKVTTMI